MYGVNVKVPLHAQRSLMSKAPIYFGDGYPYWNNRYYAKPPSGGLWAVDGGVDSATNTSSAPVAPPASTPSTKKDAPILSLPASIALTAIGGVTGFFIAQARGKDKFTGTLLGIAIVSGGQAVINTFTK